METQTEVHLMHIRDTTREMNAPKNDRGTVPMDLNGPIKSGYAFFSERPR